MSPIYLNNGKLLIQDGKLATDIKCCCREGYCCVHTCYCMCCSRQIKWTLGSTEQQLDCMIPFQVDGSPCGARARIRCNGYNATYNCDTDCTVVAIEYCANASDPACEWTTEPGDCGTVFEGLTAEVFCVGGVDPETEYGVPRGNLFIRATQEQCNAKGGDYCPSLPCEEPCHLLCPPGPKEWRIIDSNNVVWFTGDVEDNQNATVNLCSEPDDCASDFQARWILKDYPFIWEGGFSGAEVTAMYIGFSPTLRLEVLGCAGDNWSTLKGPTATTLPTNICDAHSATNWDNQLAWLALSRGCNQYTHLTDGCECMIDPTTNLPVTYQENGETKCRHCNNRIYGERGSGLEYLDHGMGVKYTNRNGDGDGSNLWNWEDDQGRYPAGWLPTETSFEGPEKTDSDITIEGTMKYWRGYRRTPDFGFPQFRNVTINSQTPTFPNLERTTVSIDMIADNITVDNASLGSYTYEPCYPYETPFRPTIRVKNQITLKNDGRAYEVDIVPEGGGTPSCLVENNSVIGTPGVPLGRPNTNVIMDCEFKNNSWFAAGTITGNVTFHSSEMGGGFNTPVLPAVINGNAIFNDSDMYGGLNENTQVNGDATFNGVSRMFHGNVTGTATFNVPSCWDGVATAGTFVPDPPPECQWD